LSFGFCHLAGGPVATLIRHKPPGNSVDVHHGVSGICSDGAASPDMCTYHALRIWTNGVQHSEGKALSIALIIHGVGFSCYTHGVYFS
jgi:hypothetical protein